MNSDDLGALLHAVSLFVGVVFGGAILVGLCRLAIMYWRDDL